MKVVVLLICNCIYNEGRIFYYVIVFKTKVVVLLIRNCIYFWLICNYIYDECSCFG